MTSGFKLFLVRHGESANNALPDPERVNDPLLTERGEQQAVRLGERFHQHVQEGMKVDLLLTSAFRRTMQTIQPMAGKLDMQPEIWSELFEVGGCYDGHLPGQMTGQTGITRDELLVEFPGYKIPDDIDDNGWYKRKPAETRDQATARAEVQAKRLMREFHSQDITVLCLIHADFKDMLIRQLLPDPSAYINDPLANTSVTLLDFSKREPDVLWFNDTTHLSSDLVSF